MGVPDRLPDRPLTHDEFRGLQESGRFDSVMAAEPPPPPGEDWLFLTLDGTEYAFHYTDERGWHRCGDGADETS